MNILAFDTCFGAVSAAVRWRSAGGEWLLREAYEARTTGHAERLFPMICGGHGRMQAWRFPRSIASA